MKTIFSVLLFITSFFIGYIIKIKLLQKKQYYSDFCTIIDEIKIKIAFFQYKLIDIISNLNPQSKLLKKNLIEYIDVITNSYELNYNLSLNLFNEDEKKNINNFFNSLGKTDLEFQSEIIDGYKKLFESYREINATRYDKYGNLSVKLGICIGLILVILLI